MSLCWDRNKKPGFKAGLLHYYARCQLLRWRDLRYITFERLVGLFDEVSIECADLGRLANKALIGVLEVNLLKLHRLLYGLGAEQLFKSLGALFEGLLRIVGDLGRDRLHTLRDHTKRLHRCIG